MNHLMNILLGATALGIGVVGLWSLFTLADAIQELSEKARGRIRLCVYFLVLIPVCYAVGWLLRT